MVAHISAHTAEIVDNGGPPATAIEVAIEVSPHEMPGAPLVLPPAFWAGYEGRSELWHDLVLHLLDLQRSGDDERLAQMLENLGEMWGRPDISGSCRQFWGQIHLWMCRCFGKKIPVPLADYLGNPANVDQMATIAA